MTVRHTACPSNTAPVVNEHSPDASQHTVDATRSSSESAPSETATAFTIIPVPTTDIATAFVRPIIAAWLADRAPRPDPPCIPISFATVTIRPYPRSIIAGITAWQYCSGPRTSFRYSASSISGPTAWSGPETSPIGSAYTTTSTRPHTSFAVVAAHFAADGSAGSPSSKPPLDALRVQHVGRALAHDPVRLHQHDARALAPHPHRHAEPDALPSANDYRDLPLKSPHACPQFQTDPYLTLSARDGESPLPSCRIRTDQPP